MKAGGRGVEPPIEGGASSKRPKRACLQRHPLLSKTLDFSEEEEEDEEEDMEKEPLCGKGRSQEAEAEEEEGDGEEEEPSGRQARRPMNAFLLFCKRHRSQVRQQHPLLDNRGATRVLADWWGSLAPTEKQTYTDMAKEYKDAFMKAHPGFRWCAPSSKAVKTPSSSSSARKKGWSFSPEPSRDGLTGRKQAKEESAPQINFSMADPTKMGGLSLLLLAGEHALTAREPTATDRTTVKVTDKVREGKTSPMDRSEICPGTSELEVTEPGEPCVNPPPVHLPKISSRSEPTAPAARKCGRSALFQLAEMCLESEARKTPTTGRRGHAHDVRGPPLTPRSASSCSSSLSTSSTPTEDTPPPLSQPLEVKRRKKSRRKREAGSTSSEPDLDSLAGTIDAVAKGSWGAEPGSPDRKCRPKPGSPNRKCRPKTKEEEEDEEEEAHVPSASADETPATPSRPATPVRGGERAAATLESSGSRKSERTCKGALYRTLVSEGMLTSLRANVDRGRRSSGRGSVSDLEGSCVDEGLTLPQTGSNTAKKPKKSKSKEESAPSVGKLEEFERKLSSLPQCSTLTSDRKVACVTKKTRGSGNGTEDPSKPPKPSRGSSPSQKKNLFHKTVPKCEDGVEQPSAVDEAVATPPVTALHTAQRAKEPGPRPLEGLGGAETLVGSQKRKARKRKITHLVRSADGRMSPAHEERARKLGQEVKPSSSPSSSCNEDRAVTAVTTVSSDRPGASGLPPLFSLAALAEVAAMEHTHSGPHTASLPQEVQSMEHTQR